jgi:glycosyltransferase involved in cell wall biosynthesis
MRLLFCCEFYYPSVGGVQEVMRQLAERMVQLGHDVTVATSFLPNREFKELNGVRIAEFDVTGNVVKGMKGEVDRYRAFVLNIEADAILIKAAQQWTFDALWPVLHKIHARKVLIPCGFSGLYRPSFSEYFKQLPGILRLLDHLIFYAKEYRDVEFVRAHGMRHFSVIPNGASEIEFASPCDQSFRVRYGIPEQGFVFLTVGSLTGMKGHLEVTKAFAKLDTGGKPAILLLNGNFPVPPPVNTRREDVDSSFRAVSCTRQHAYNMIGCVKEIVPIARRINGKILPRVMLVKEIISERGWPGVAELTISIIARRLNRLSIPILGNIPIDFMSSLKHWIRKANSQSPLKRVLLVDLPRQELIQAYKTADLFVFASNIEYSPLVLFESAAAGTPFLSVPVGNAEEIARWTGCGIIVKAPIDKRGFTRANPRKLAVEMRKAMDSPQLLAELGRTGFERWQERYTWAKICLQYQKILAGNYE